MGKPGFPIIIFLLFKVTMVKIKPRPRPLSVIIRPSSTTNYRDDHSSFIARHRYDSRYMARRNSAVSTRGKTSLIAKPKKVPSKPSPWTTKSLLWKLLWLAVTYYAVRKAYQCNKHESKLILIPVVALAFFYSPHYLIYYGIFHFILRVPCMTGVGSMSLNV